MPVAITKVMEYYQIAVLNPVVVDTWFHFFHNMCVTGHVDLHCISHGCDDMSLEQLMMWLHLGIAFKIRSLCDQVADRICATRISPEDYGYSIAKHVFEKLNKEIEGLEVQRRAVTTMPLRVWVRTPPDDDGARLERARRFDFFHERA